MQCTPPNLFCTALCAQGFHDNVYKQRRVMIANRAKAHKM